MSRLPDGLAGLFSSSAASHPDHALPPGLASLIPANCGPAEQQALHNALASINVDASGQQQQVLGTPSVSAQNPYTPGSGNLAVANPLARLTPSQITHLAAFALMQHNSGPPPVARPATGSRGSQGRFHAFSHIFGDTWLFASSLTSM